MGRKRSKYYIDPAELFNEITHYQNTGVLTENLGVMLIKLARRFSTRQNFTNYSYKDEFISDAIYRMVEQIDKINLTHPKCNPFSYLTLVCHRCFIARINREHRYQNLKLKLKDKYFDELEAEEYVFFKKNGNEGEVEEEVE